MSFDSLTFARRLKAAGFPDSQAEALADANREMVVYDTATKDDVTSLKTDIANLRTELKADTANLRTELKADIAALEERLTLRLTVRFGVMLAAALSLMTAIMGVLLRFH
jgi:hypothetical protein